MSNSEKSLADLHKQIDQIEFKRDLDRAVDSKVNKSMVKLILQHWQTIGLVIGIITVFLIFNKYEFDRVDKRFDRLEAKIDKK